MSKAANVIAKEQAELQAIYDGLSAERKAELDAEYVRVCEESGCACCWYSFLSQFM